MFSEWSVLVIIMLSIHIYLMQDIQSQWNQACKASLELRGKACLPIYGLATLRSSIQVERFHFFVKRKMIGIHKLTDSSWAVVCIYDACVRISLLSTRIYSTLPRKASEERKFGLLEKVTSGVHMLCNWHLFTLFTLC